MSDTKTEALEVDVVELTQRLEFLMEQIQEAKRLLTGQVRCTEDLHSLIRTFVKKDKAIRSAGYELFRYASSEATEREIQDRTAAAESHARACPRCSGKMNVLLFMGVQPEGWVCPACKLWFMDDDPEYGAVVIG